tara:strand:+ start:456 stop:1127 length:672 start_codon:yes stop_codon:yes gene_type:complete
MSEFENSFMPIIVPKTIEDTDTEAEKPTEVNDIMSVGEVDEEEVVEEKDDCETRKEDEEELPVVEPRPRVDTNDVFKPKTVKTDVPIVHKTKRVMSDKQKEHLKKAREKACENRRLRKEAKERGDEVPKSKKALREQKVVKEFADSIPQTVNITNNITKEEIEEISNRATAKAIENYDKNRKIRKQEKQVRVKKETEQKNIQNTIRQAAGRSYGSDGFFNECF